MRFKLLILALVNGQEMTYRSFVRNKSWQEAQTACRKFPGGKLAVISDLKAW